jgi:hypothetical protein
MTQPWSRWRRGAKEVTKVAVRKLREGVVAREAEAQMYIDDTADEEARIVTAAVVTAERSSPWLLVDGDETEVEDDDEDEEAERSATPSCVLRTRPSARRSASPRRKRSASPRWRLRSAMRQSGPPTGRPRWTRSSPTEGTSVRGKLAAVPRLTTALRGAGLCAARTLLTAS